MRRIVAIGAAIVMTLGIAGVLPAQATHCNQNNIASCPEPLVLWVIEGIGNVCDKAVLTDDEEAKYGTKCTYNYNDPTWASKPVSPWNVKDGANGSKYQGLFWPGVGPGALGPYSLRVSKSVSPPGNACVASVAGPGCESNAVGRLTPGSNTGVGAHCGTSKGSGSIYFRSADGSLIMHGTNTWEQSAGTILPFRGEITHGVRSGKAFSYPAGGRPTVMGYTSARGLGGSGNCGISDPTTGFQVEGFVSTF